LRKNSFNYKELFLKIMKMNTQYRKDLSFILEEGTFRNFPEFILNEWNMYGLFITRTNDAYCTLPYGKVDKYEKENLDLYSLHKMTSKEKKEIEETIRNYREKIQWMDEIMKDDYQWNKNHVSMNTLKTGIQERNIRAFYLLKQWHEMEGFEMEILHYHPEAEIGKIYIVCADGIAEIDIENVDVRLGAESFLPEKIVYLKPNEREVLKEVFQETKKEYEKSILELEQIINTLRIRSLFEERKEYENK